MPASTLDPVNAALRNALSKSSSSSSNAESSSLDVQLAGTTKKALLSNIEFEPAGSYQSTVLDKLKSKYIVLKSSEPTTPTASKAENMGGEEMLTLAKHELFPLSAVQLGWNNSDWTVGAGMVNMGNTCYLNSTLQALFHVPALVNWLVSDKHMSECEDSGGYCIICAMRKTLQDSQQRNANSIRPFLIYNKLRVVCRNLIPGRQEDAHEFLRYLVEAMEKSYLGRFKNHQQFDSRTKETTPLNQILGGYLRSAVRCLDCGHVSTTFQHFQDLLLDIRKAQTLEEALDAYFSREQLDDQSYHCESCQKKVPATKQFSLERAPMVLCIQLKRFSVTNNKITKHVQFKQRLELTKYSRNRPNTPLVYRLVALVTHMGPTVGCGHYTAVAQAPCGNFYQFDDSMVRPISHQAVFTTNAYIMLYELEQPPSHVKPAATNGVAKSKTLGIKETEKSVKIYTPSSTASSSSSSTSATSSKLLTNGTVTPNNSSSSNNENKRLAVYGPELPPNKLFKLEDQNGTVTSTLNGHNSSSSSSESESEQVMAKTAVSAKEVKKTNSSSLTRTLSSNSGCSNSTNNNNNSTPSASTSTSSTSVVSSTTSQLTKLVPYEEDDSSSDDDEDESIAETKIATKVTTNGEWKVTSSTDNQLTDGSKKKPVNDRATVNELLKMSTGGYSAPVSTWNGTRAHLDKEIANEKREDRKRSQVDELDQGRVKHVKTSNGGSFKSNPGYNPFQEYQNNSYRQYYKTSRHRNNRRYTHRKNNFHNKNNHRFRH